MISIIVQISKYVLLFLMAIYTVNAFLVFTGRKNGRRKAYENTEMSIMILFDLIAFAILYLQCRDFTVLIILGGLLAYVILIQLLYRLIYKKASIALVNAMCMLLSIGFVIQTRMGFGTAKKQLVIVIISSALCLIIPVFIRYVKTMRNLGWVYAILGILLLGGVFAFGRISGGANLSVTIGGISFQFSEFVKITFVFFIAGMLQKTTSFRQVVTVSVLAALHVGILVLSRDLGAALIYFVSYIVMVYVSTKKVEYVAIGLGGMTVASLAAYRLFTHVRVRVQVWRDPFRDYEGTGYQIVQALFGVCAGGWFGTGLFNGNPEMIPLAKEDFTYAAICEEFGILFGICLILLCMSVYLLIVSISTKLSNRFYRLVAIGLGTEYAFQVFLTVGGTTKFIPMTGITLPLVSYGGSSIMCTIIMLSIIQGLYMIREDEEEEHELLEEIIRRQNEKERHQQLMRQAEAVSSSRRVRRNASSAGGRRQDKNTSSGMPFRHQERHTAPGSASRRQDRTTAAGTASRRQKTAPSSDMNTGAVRRREAQPGAGPEYPAGEAVRRPEDLTESKLLKQIPQESDAVNSDDFDSLERRIEDETEKSLNYQR